MNDAEFLEPLHQVGWNSEFFESFQGGGVR
jgi:hypothetical protein